MVGVLMEEREERYCPPTFGGPSTPWLIYPNGYSIKSHTFCNILEPNKNCIKRIPQMRRNICYASSHGWLVLLGLAGNTGCCSLWNPISLETIYLPDLKLGDDDDFHLRSCTLTSAPTDPSCMILFFCSIPLIIYCQPGDTRWTRHSFEIEDGGIKHAVGLSDGTIYASTLRSKLAIIRKDSSGCLSLKQLNVEHPEMPPETKRIWQFDLESCGELFRVYFYFSASSDAVKRIKVFKLDSSQMDWVKVEGLGGQVFFLIPYDGSCTSCSADEQSGLEGDCIYFTYPEDKSLYVFDMKDDSISVSLPYPDPRRPWSNPFWFIPMTKNRMVDTTIDNERRTIIDDKKMMVKQSLKEMSKEEQKVETINSIFFNLSKDLQHLIPTHLTSVVDYMNFRATCKPLRSTAPPIQLRSPWLMGVQKGVGFFLDPECNSIYRMNIHDLFGCTIRFSKDGWLLVSKGDFSMFFFDPFTKTKIELPDMTEHYSFQGICFSSLPTSSDCVIFGIGFRSGDSVMIGWYRLGQENWSFNEIYIGDEYLPFSLSYSNPVFYDGAFYCLSHEGCLGVFDLNAGWTVHLNPQPCSTASQTYMVECDGELLSVFLDDGGNTTIISRLDRTMMCWVEVKSLSDKMLFLSPSTSMAIETQEKKLQNKIFLPRFWSKNKNDIVFYSLETEKYHSLSRSSFSSCDFYGTKEQLFCCWIQPNVVWRNIPCEESSLLYI